MTSPKRTPVRLHLSTVVAASLIVLAAGCGSSSSGDSSPTTTAPSPAALTAAEWKQQANAICADTGPEIGAAFEAMDPAAPTDAQVAHVIDTLVSVNRDTERRIKALAAPASLAGQAKALLDANEAATAAVERQGPAALDQLDQLFATPNQLATKLGLEACAG